MNLSRLPPEITPTMGLDSIGSRSSAGLNKTLSSPVSTTSDLGGEGQAIRSRTHHTQIPAKIRAKKVNIANSYHWNAQ